MKILVEFACKIHYEISWPGFLKKNFAEKKDKCNQERQAPSVIGNSTYNERKIITLDGRP